LKHVLQEFFHRHCVTANTAALKKVAVTRPRATLKGNPMLIILAVNPHSKGLKVEAMRFRGITFGLLNLPNHPIVHSFFSFCPQAQR
jgi:hypothetical protein